MSGLLRRCSMAILAVLVLLCLPMVGWAQTTIKEEAKAAKVSPDLFDVITNQGIPAPAQVDGLQKVNLFMLNGNTIAIEAVAGPGQDVQSLFQALQALGLQNGKVYQQIVTGYLPIDKLVELKNVDALKFARPSYRPTKNTGSVTSQGDVALRADVARSTYNVTGAGTKVGVMSDSYNALNGAASGVSTGDLPSGVQVLQDYTASGATDEGRAMAEIVHDVAPGAAIAFNTAYIGGEAGFAAGIRALASAGCKVITDDVGYFAEPFFQDGLVAQAVDDVVTNSGATHFSSAGNAARSSYQNAYSSTSFSESGYYGGNTFTAHNFSGGDKRQTITIPGGGEALISFQWDDPFFSVSGGAGAQTDMDLLVYVNNVYRPSLSSVGNNIGGDPVEIIDITNNGGSAVNVELVLVKHAGPDPTIVKWVNFGSTLSIEYDTKSSTCVGHANSSKAVGVGAAPWYNTPAFNNSLTTAVIEPFSSAGGTPILFNTSGQRISTVTRQKPEITSVDGGNTTFFYSDSQSDPDSYPNFFGTSASAPHAAGVAALMREKSGNTISPASILSIMESTALDMDDPLTPSFDTGFDFRTGYGFIQANAALAAIGGGSNTAPTVANAISPQSATVGQAFSFTIPSNTFTDAETPNSLTITVSNLPAGLSYSNGTISGTPTTAGSFTVTVTATDPGNLSVSTTFVITVSPAQSSNTAPTVANAISPQSATVGQAFSFTIPSNTFTDAETPNSLTITVSNLPAGLSYSSSNRTISGTPTTAGSYTVTVTATDPGGLSVSTTFVITVSPAQASNTPPTVANAIGPRSATAGQAFSFTIPSNTFTDAETPNSLTITVSNLPAGLSFANGTISGTPTTAGSYTITVTATDPGGLSVSTTFVLTVATGGGKGNTAPTVANAIGPRSATVGQAFTFTIPSNTFTDAQTPNSLVITVSGLPPGLSYSNGTISGTPTTAGSYTVTVTATDPGNLSVSTTFVITVSPAQASNTPPTVANAIGPRSATVGQAFSFTIPSNTFTDAETPNSLTITVSGLPAGLTFSGGTISGTPTTAGSYTVTVTATDPGNLSVSTTFVITVSPAQASNTPPTVANAIGPRSATVGQAFSFTIPSNTFTDAETPNSLTITVSNLPAGLSYSSSNRTISGTPTTAGSYTVTVTATDPGGLSVSTTFVITVSPAQASNTPPTVANAIGPRSATRGVAFSFTIPSNTFTDAETPNSLTITVSGLPAGLSFANGTISGTPTTAGSYTITVTATDPGGLSVSTTFVLTVANGPKGRVGTDEPVVSLSVVLYPNPVAEEFSIGIKGAQGQTVRIMLTDLNGSPLTNTSVDVTTPEHREQLRIGQQRAGLYLLRVSTAKEAVTLKVIKQ